MVVLSFLFPSFPLACECDPDGTLNFNTSVCAAFGGGCGPCRLGVTGQSCDTCLNGFFEFSATGCTGECY